jgi:hypothetical protein
MFVPRELVSRKSSTQSEGLQPWVGQKKTHSGDLDRPNCIYISVTRAVPAKWAPLLKQRPYQPQGWPTLIFEN